MSAEIERSNGRRRAALGKLLAAVLVALPGAYAAVRTQSAADADAVRTEVVLRDRQEDAIRKHVEAIRREIAAVREAAVTHRELLEVVLKLRRRGRERGVSSPTRRREASERERALEVKLEALRRREAEAARAKVRVDVAQRALPELRPANVVRKAVRKDH
jgi:hypothetical protein